MPFGRLVNGRADEAADGGLITLTAGPAPNNLRIVKYVYSVNILCYTIDNPFSGG